MKCANAFAVSDSAMRPIHLGVDGVIQTQGAAQATEEGNQGLSRREHRENNRNNSNNRQNNEKRKDEQPDA